jgi:hypothetical protein
MKNKYKGGSCMLGVDLSPIRIECISYKTTNSNGDIIYQVAVDVDGVEHTVLVNQDFYFQQDKLEEFLDTLQKRSCFKIEVKRWLTHQLENE